MKSLRKENLSSSDGLSGPRFRMLPEMIDGLRLEVSLEVPSDLRFVGPAAGYFSRLAREHGFHERVWAENLPLVLDEAITNAIRHGHDLEVGKTVRITGRLENNSLEIRVEDEGSGFDPDALPDPREGDSLYRSSGRGVFLIRNLCDEVSFEKGGSCVVIVFRNQAGG